MDEQPQDLQGYVDPLQMAYNVPPYQPIHMVDGNVMMAPTNQAQPPPPPPFPIPPQVPNQPPYLPPQQQQQQQLHSQQHLQHALHNFWRSQHQEILQTKDFKNHSLPLARVKKIMKADEDVRMIAAEAPVLFARACEMFILELTLRSWAHTEESKRRTLQKNDIAAAITRTEAFDFLIDIVPKDEAKEEGVGGSGENAGAGNEQMPYYYVPPQHQGVVPTGIMPPMDQGVMFQQQQQQFAATQQQQQQQVWTQELQGQIEQQQQQQQQQPFPSEF